MQAFDFGAFSKRLNSESDRACAVLGVALLDAKLETLFKRNLKCFWKELLEGMGPLSTFSSRIKVARAMDWVSEDARSDLDTLRGIRNAFAHSFDHNLAFSDQSISNRCRNLRSAEAFITGYDLAAAKPKVNISAAVIRAMQAVFEPPRWRFQLGVEFLAQYLDDVASDVTVTSAPDLLREVRALSANMRIQISNTGWAGPAR